MLLSDKKIEECKNVARIELPKLLNEVAGYLSTGDYESAAEACAKLNTNIIAFAMMDELLESLEDTEDAE